MTKYKIIIPLEQTKTPYRGYDGRDYYSYEALQEANRTYRETWFRKIKPDEYLIKRIKK